MPVSMLLDNNTAKPLYKGKQKVTQLSTTAIILVKVIFTIENNLQKQPTSLQRLNFMSQVWPI